MRRGSSGSRPAPESMWCANCNAQIGNWKAACPGCGHEHESFSEVHTRFNPSDVVKEALAREDAQRDAARSAAIGRLKARLETLEARGASGIYVPGTFAKLFSAERYRYNYAFIDGELMLVNWTHPNAGRQGLSSGAYIGVAKFSERKYSDMNFTPTLFGNKGTVDLKTLKRL
ncbi:hypothetical protein [Tropicimonas sp. IMCC6043]|uniref:hypothetical protein n=1 Tax=Tropicimonas sp. IMCC6043 TaxID=2510645 RepID=UPI00101B73A1|nr:hypothetical protein [Tropicimonas sp. IMCC6043]RYH06122.1 hypothetical protein EU800_24975 [Tropicimonas sp. IMCC6043]